MEVLADDYRTDASLDPPKDLRRDERGYRVQHACRLWRIAYSVCLLTDTACGVSPTDTPLTLRRAPNAPTGPTDICHARNFSASRRGRGGFSLENCGNDEERSARLFPGSLAQPTSPAGSHLETSGVLIRYAACDARHSSRA